MTQDTCDRLLAAKFEGLREECPCTWCSTRGVPGDPRHGEWCHPSKTGHGKVACHGLGYVPQVTLERLLEAFPGMWSIDQRDEDGLICASYWPPGMTPEWGPPPEAMGETHLLAVSRAAVIAEDLA